MDADADVEVVEQRLAFIDADAPGDLRVLVVKHVPLNVAPVNLWNLRFVIPVARQPGEVVVELALAKHLERLVRTGDDFVLQEVAIEHVAVVLQVARPPVLHPTQRDGATALHEVGIDHISPDHRANAPLVTRRVIGAKLAVKMPRTGRQHRIPDGIRLGLRNGHGEGAIVVLGDGLILLRVPVVVPGVFDVRTGHDKEGHEKILHGERHPVRERYSILETEIDRFAILRDRPFLGQSRNPDVLIRMTRDQTDLDVVVVLAAKGVVRIRPHFAKGGWEGRMPFVKGAALFGPGIAKLRHLGGVFPFQVGGQIRGGFELKKLRLRLPVRLHFLRVVIRRKTGVLTVGAGTESTQAEPSRHPPPPGREKWLLTLG